MATARVERRLAAILAADVVGYSRLMERDEDRHARPAQGPPQGVHRARSSPSTRAASSSSWATARWSSSPASWTPSRCAVLIQQGMAEREAGVPEAERIRFRIGINLGDVVHEADGDLYGDGVNVAARLEQLADPGGVVVSGTAYDHLRGKLDGALECLGERQLKNIERPVRVYRVVLGRCERVGSGRRCRRPTSRRSRSSRSTT